MRDSVLELDRRVIVWFGRRVRAWQAQTVRPLHPLLFWGAAGAYAVVWLALSALLDEPYVLWLVLGSAPGVVAAYIVDSEPVAPLEEGLALTHMGLDARWCFLRPLYAVGAIVVFLPVILGSDSPVLVAPLFLLALALFLLLEYLLTFRVVPPDHPVFAAQAEADALRDAFRTFLDRAEDQPDDVAAPTDTPTEQAEPTDTDGSA